VNLVNADQVDILRSLRASVSVEKDSLVADFDRLQKALRDGEEKARTQAEQVRFPFFLPLARSSGRSEADEVEGR
jgi:hypothetical protein